jgi:quinol-cytochrome oxidoreductase complex cytochrome b subunit
MLHALHRAGQLAFLAVERLFNRAFGEASNPFYYLGAISYFLLWIVIASGLYLYAFFSTGVTEAHQSVEAITHGQRWVGGIVRSLHRYASDGLVLTMLLHVARHFVFDHYRAFRWFSWVSGVVLLWLVVVSGVNGYMLPWDRLAQFVVVATAEWLDWLPIFNGTLVRNFITPEAVNDRLFSLLSFLHIGFPLGVLALLWVHTQRAPGARTNPPRAIAIPLTAALVALSIVKPALSLAPANLLSAPADLAFDWFYLPALAALYAWGPAMLWAIVGGGTLLMLALPWLPPRRAGQAVRTWRCAGQPDRARAPGRDAARGAAARRGADSLRLPQRRLRQVQVHGRLRPGRARALPARGAVGRRARRRARCSPASPRRSATSRSSTSRSCRPAASGRARGARRSRRWRRPPTT